MLSSFVSLHYVYGLVIYYKYQDGKWLGWGNALTREDRLVVPLSQMSPITSPLLRDSGSVRDRSGLTTQDCLALWVQLYSYMFKMGFTCKV